MQQYRKGPLRSGGDPFCVYRAVQCRGSGSFRNSGALGLRLPVSRGKDSLFPLPVCRKTGAVWRFQGTAPAFPPGARAAGKAGLPEPASRATVRTGRDGSCGHKKKTVPGKDRPRCFRAGRRYLACSLSTSIIFFCGLIMQASMNSWISESDFRMDFAVFWVLRFQASSQIMKPLASSGSSA